MKPEDPPRPTGIEKVIDPRGLFVAVFGEPGVAFLLQFTAGPLGVALFTSRETWERFRSEFPELALGLRLAKVDDLVEFLSCIPEGYVLAVDVRRSETGTVKWHDLQLPGVHLVVIPPG